MILKLFMYTTGTGECSYYDVVCQVRVVVESSEKSETHPYRDAPFPAHKNRGSHYTPQVFKQP